MERRSLALIVIIILTVCISLIVSLFSLQIENEAFARQLLPYAVCSLLLGATALAGLIVRQFVQNAQRGIEKHVNKTEGAYYEKV